MGSYNAPLRASLCRFLNDGNEDRDAEGNMPIEPPITAASSDSMSPKVFSVTMTSKLAGFVTSCIAPLSASMCISSTSRYSMLTSSTISRHSLPVSSTFILSRECTLRRLCIAISKATLATLSISRSVYFMVSTADLPREVAHRFLGFPKYSPPVSSRTISISTPCNISGLSGLACMSWGYSFTGRRFANRLRDFRSFSMPSSGLVVACGSSHFGPPTAPNSTVSQPLIISRVSSGSGSPH